MKHIIVLGHSGCGGIGAAVSGERFGLIDHWLQPVRDVADLLFECRGCGFWTDEDLDRLCEASVTTQVERLARTPTCGRHGKVGML